MSLRVRTWQEPGVVRIAVAGEVDTASVEQLRDAVTRAEQEDAPEIVLDLDGVAFFDSAGVGVLLDADHRATNAGRRLTVQAQEGDAARVLQLVRVHELLTATRLSYRS